MEVEGGGRAEVGDGAGEGDEAVVGAGDGPGAADVGEGVELRTCVREAVKVDEQGVLGDELVAAEVGEVEMGVQGGFADGAGCLDGEGDGAAQAGIGTGEEAGGLAEGRGAPGGVEGEGDVAEAGSAAQATFEL